MASRRPLLLPALLLVLHLLAPLGSRQPITKASSVASHALFADELDPPASSSSSPAGDADAPAAAQSPKLAQQVPAPMKQHKQQHQDLSSPMARGDNNNVDSSSLLDASADKLDLGSLAPGAASDAPQTRRTRPAESGSAAAVADEPARGQLAAAPTLAGGVSPLASAANAANDDNVEGELCSLNTIVRQRTQPAAESAPSQQLMALVMSAKATAKVAAAPQPQPPPPSSGQQQELVERSLTCSHVNESNYHLMMQGIYRRQSRLTIQQLHLTNCEPLVVLSAIDLICGQLNCSALTVFNVSGHQIVDFHKLANWLGSWRHLRVLDLSGTSLRSAATILGRAGALTELRLDHNELTEWDFDFVLERAPNLRQLSLVNNSIFQLSCSEQLRPRLRSQIELLWLANNSINCERNQLWLMKLIQGAPATKPHSLAAPTNLKFPDHEQIRCRSPERLVEMTWSQRVSVLETRICDDCDCRSLKRTAISVDCHNKNLTALPDVLPLNTKILNLTSNHIHSLSVAQNSRNWENVTYVYLENNLISSMEFSSKFMRNLAALDIRRNKFQEFPSHLFELLINLDQVHLSDNPWLCNCEATFAFQEWLQRQFHKVGDKEDIRCGVAGADQNGLKSSGLEQRLSGRVIYRLAKSELCPQDGLEEPYDWLDVANWTLSVSIVLIVTKVVLDYIYQHRTKRLPHFFKLNF